jgi:uncharacterized damage-inducible protein DinB
MSKLTSLVAEYLAAPRTLRQAVAGMSREQLLARPVAGKMSTLEVVVHIADFEPILAERMKRVLTHDRPQLLAADENLFLAKLAYHERDLEEELAIIDTTRSQMARILRTMGDDVLARVGVHSERGERTMEQLLSGATGHITHHVAFIHEKRKALGV